MRDGINGENRVMLTFYLLYTELLGKWGMLSCYALRKHIESRKSYN